MLGLRASRFPPAAPLLVAATALGVLHGFWPAGALWWATGSTMLAAIVALWPHARRQSRRLAAAFVLLAAGALVWAPPLVVIEAAVRGAEVVAVLVAAQLLAGAVTGARYDRVVRKLLARLRWHPTWVALIAGYLLTWPFSLSSIPVVYASLFGEREQQAAAPADQVDTAVLLARAFGAAALVAPSQPTVLLAIAVAGAPLLPFLALAVPLSWIMLLLGLWGAAQRAGQPATAGAFAKAPAGAPAGLKPAATASGAESARTGESDAEMRWGPVLLTGLFLSLAAAIYLVSRLPAGTVTGMAAAIALAAFAWGGLGRRLLNPEARSQPLSFAGWARDFTARLADGGLLVPVGSVAGFTLTRTPLVELAGAVLERVELPLAAAVLTLVVVVGLRLLGVAPAVIILTVGPLLVEALPLNAVALAALLSTGSFLSFVVSPFSMTTAMIASLTGWSPVELSLPRQGRYALVAGAVAVLYVSLFGFLARA